MLKFKTLLLTLGALCVAVSSSAFAQCETQDTQPIPLSPHGVQILQPKGAIKPNATWSVAARAGDMVYVAGMRGFKPCTYELVDGTENRIRQAFRNLKVVVESEGATLRDVVLLNEYAQNMDNIRPLVNKIQAEPEFWGDGPYPPRIITQAQPNQNDVFEVQGIFYAPLSDAAKRRRGLPIKPITVGQGKNGIELSYVPVASETP